LSLFAELTLEEEEDELKLDTARLFRKDPDVSDELSEPVGVGGCWALETAELNSSSCTLLELG
jgi:hypothetical protein